MMEFQRKEKLSADNFISYIRKKKFISADDMRNICKGNGIFSLFNCTTSEAKEKS